MNSSKHGQASNQQFRPYSIEYIKGDRLVRDSARSLEGAKALIAARLAKRHNRGEVARVLFRGEVVHTSYGLFKTNQEFAAVYGG